MTNRHTYFCDIDSYEQESSKVFVSDPSYHYQPDEHLKKNKNMVLNKLIKNVEKGRWKVILGIRKDQQDRNAELLSFHSSVMETDYQNGDQWEKVAEIGVDSGQAGIYDLKHYDASNEAWYDMNCALTSQATDYAGTLPHGAVSQSGFGDGFYSVYVIKQLEKIVGIKVTFITDVEIEKWNKLINQH